MKLATLQTDPLHRDGSLCVVNNALTQAVFVPDIAPTLQKALEDWNTTQPLLEHVYLALEQGNLPNAFIFNPRKTAAPLPRAYQWLDASAYVNHIELVRKARNSPMPDNFWTDPLMYQGGSDSLLGACHPIVAADLAYGIDFEAEIGIITDDVPMGVSVQAAGKHIKLFVLINDVTLRNLIPDELAKGFGFLQAKPSTGFSPVAITPDLLGKHWDGQRVHLPLLTHLNDKKIGQPNAGVDMTFSFPQLIAHAAKTRSLSAGTILGSGTVSNKDPEQGSSCLVEKRMREILQTGSPHTPYMQWGDCVRIEMHDAHGQTLMGAIEQILVQYKGSP